MGASPVFEVWSYDAEPYNYLSELYKERKEKVLEEARKLNPKIEDIDRYDYRYTDGNAYAYAETLRVKVRGQWVVYVISSIDYTIHDADYEVDAEKFIYHLTDEEIETELQKLKEEFVEEMGFELPIDPRDTVDLYDMFGFGVVWVS